MADEKTMKWDFQKTGEKVGVLHFDGQKFIFSGDADKSAKLFLDSLNHNFKNQLTEAREKIETLESKKCGCNG